MLGPLDTAFEITYVRCPVQKRLTTLVDENGRQLENAGDVLADLFNYKARGSVLTEK